MDRKQSQPSSCAERLPGQAWAAWRIAKPRSWGVIARARWARLTEFDANKSSFHWSTSEARTSSCGPGCNSGVLQACRDDRIDQLERPRCRDQLTLGSAVVELALGAARWSKPLVINMSRWSAGLIAATGRLGEGTAAVNLRVVALALRGLAA